MKFFLISSWLLIFTLHCISQDTRNLTNHPNIHKIMVKEVLQTTSYTYINAEENDTLQWIAIPKMEAMVGETYYYHGGMEMGEFKSKELDRTFTSILFLNGLISPEVVEGEGNQSIVSPQKTKIVDEKLDGPIDPAEGGITIAELYANKEKYASKIVKIRGKVTKFNAKIMSRNWIHLQDGTGSSGDLDITATSQDEVKVGDIITIEGMIALNKDFGAGYFYSIIMENSRTIKSAE